MVDVVDENDHLVDTVTRKEVRAKNLRHRCVYYFIFNSKDELLITKRTMTKDIYPGMYELPGGMVRVGESYEEGAIREMEEEFGIKNPELKFLFDFRYEDETSKGISKVYSCVYDGKIKQQKEEIESYFFISIEKLKKMMGESPEKFPKNRIMIFEKYLGEKIN